MRKVAAAGTWPALTQRHKKEMQGYDSTCSSAMAAVPVKAPGIPCITSRHAPDSGVWLQCCCCDPPLLSPSKGTGRHHPKNTERSFQATMLVANIHACHHPASDLLASQLSDSCPASTTTSSTHPPRPQFITPAATMPQQLASQAGWPCSHRSASSARACVRLLARSRVARAPRMPRLHAAVRITVVAWQLKGDTPSVAHNPRLLRPTGRHLRTLATAG